MKPKRKLVYLLVGKASSNANNADQMVEEIIRIEFLIKEATNQIVYEIRKARSQCFHLRIYYDQPFTNVIGCLIIISFSVFKTNKKKLIILVFTTCFLKTFRFQILFSENKKQLPNLNSYQKLQIELLSLSSLSVFILSYKT